MRVIKNSCLSLFLLCSFILGLYKLTDKGVKFYYKRCLHHPKFFTFFDIEGFYEVYPYLHAKEKLAKGSHFSKKEIKHLRLADKKSIGSLFEKETITSIPVWIDKLVKQEFTYYENHPFRLDTLLDCIKNFQQKGSNWEQEYSLALFTIYQKKLYVRDFSKKHARLHDVSVALDRLHRSLCLPDMTFLVSFHDSLFRTDAPIFVFSKKIEDDSLLLIPDHEHLMNYSTLDAQIDEGIVLYPWKNKKKLAFWRGGTSGGVFTSEKWMGYPRSKLVLLSKTHPHLLDAKFSSLVLGAENLKEVFLKQNLLSDLVSAKQHLAYRYLIDIDGNASTYSRFYWILRSNSTPMKQQSHFKQWYYPLLVPYVHFIPFKEDLSDLLEQIQWGLNHERESQEIAEKSKQFAIDYLSEISTFTYLYAMLLKYQQLCN